MITIKHYVYIEIEIIDGSKAIDKNGILTQLISKPPGRCRFADRKVEEKITNEINNHLFTESIQRQINRSLCDRGVQSMVRVTYN